MASATAAPENPIDPPTTHPEPDATPILRIAPNITVRAYQTRDIAATVKHGNSAAIAANLRNTYPYPYTHAAATSWISKSQDPATHVASGPFDAVTQTGTLAPLATKYCICVDDEAVGGIGVRIGEDVEVRCAEVGYWLGEAFWGRGIMSAVVPRFVAWVWGTFGRVLRIEGFAFEGNPASCRLLEKAGLVRFGRREKAIWKGGRALGLDCFGAVREGYEGV